MDTPELLQRLPVASDVAWWQEIASAAPARTVLFVGCGTGRTAMPLVAPSARFVGVDSDAGLLEAFHARLVDAPGEEHAELVLGPLEDLGEALRGTEPRHFGLVVVPNTIVNGVGEPARRVQVLTEAAHKLSADGRLVLQVLNPYWLANEGTTVSGELPDGDGTVRVQVHHDAFDAWGQTYRGRVTYRFSDGRELSDHIEAVALFPRELRALAHQAGLEINASYGATPGQDPLGLPGGTWHLVCRRRPS